MNIDETKKGVRLLARAVSCSCTKLPKDIDAILVKAKHCKVTVYEEAYFKSSIRTFTTSSINGQVFKSGAEEMAAELGEEEHVKVGSGSGQEYKQFRNERMLGSGEKAGLWRRRRRGSGLFGGIERAAKSAARRVAAHARRVAAAAREVGRKVVERAKEKAKAAAKFVADKAKAVEQKGREKCH